MFVLAGQSNMEGKAQNPLWDHQATAAKTAEVFAPLRDGDGWVTRDDVFIKFLGRTGKLTLGYGSRGRTGCEFAFGVEVGNALDAPVVLVKAAWGGHALAKQFRPPSSGLPAPEVLEKELVQARERVTKRNEKNNRSDPLPEMASIEEVYGSSYRNMLAEVRAVLSDPGAVADELAGRPAQLAGFVWFQGWNDQYGGLEQQYAGHMERFIDDVRKDLDAPGLPFVIGVMGQNGSKPAQGAMLAIQEAQVATAALERFAGTVRAVRTAELVDTAAEELYPRWKKEFEQWKLIGSDHPYHYLGSAIWFTRIGRAFAAAALDLRAAAAKR